MQSEKQSAISSRGCSKAFIICVLYRALHYVASNLNQPHESRRKCQFPFDSVEVKSWLALAKNDAQKENFEAVFGGTILVESNTRTYWTEPSQFSNWWKNNVERKAKNSMLLVTAGVRWGHFAVRQRQRLQYCRAVVALTTNIKVLAGKRINYGPLSIPSTTLVKIEFKIPSHMPAIELPEYCRILHLSDYFPSLKSIATDFTSPPFQDSGDSDLSSEILLDEFIANRGLRGADSNHLKRTRSHLDEGTETFTTDQSEDSLIVMTPQSLCTAKIPSAPCKLKQRKVYFGRGVLSPIRPQVLFPEDSITSFSE